MRSTDPDIQQHIDALCHDKETLIKENYLLRDRIRELEMRIETQKQTLAARDDSIKKMVEMMNNKGIATKIMEDERLEMDKIKSRNIELETRLRHFESIIEAKEKDIIKVSFLISFFICFLFTPFDYDLTSNTRLNFMLQLLTPTFTLPRMYPQTQPSTILYV